MELLLVWFAFDSQTGAAFNAAMSASVVCAHALTHSSMLLGMRARAYAEGRPRRRRPTVGHPMRLGTGGPLLSDDG